MKRHPPHAPRQQFDRKSRPGDTFARRSRNGERAEGQKPAARPAAAPPAEAAAAHRQKSRATRRDGHRQLEALVSYNIWRSSQTWTQPSKEPFKKIFAEIGRQASVKGEKKRLVKVLRRSGEERWIRQADKVQACRRVVRYDAAGARCEIRSCSNRWCSYCGRKQAAVRREDLAYAFCAVEHHYPARKHFHAFITLTIDDRRLPAGERNLKGKVKAIRAEITRMLNQRSFKQGLNIGSYYKIETTFNKVTARANVHAHMVMVCGGTRAQLDREIRQTWSLGKIIQVKKFRLNGQKGIYEISKGVASYLQKSWEVEHDSQLMDLVRAFHNVKINGATGCIRLFLRQAKQHREEKINTGDVPKPPQLTEAQDLAYGKYDKGQLLLAIQKGSKTALELLKLLEYRIVFGVRYEEQSAVSDKGETIGITAGFEGSL